MALKIIDRICSGLPIRAISAVTCLVVILVQAGILNYYLVLDKGPIWWSWWLGDAFVFGFFIAAFVMSFRLLEEEKWDRDHGITGRVKPPGELPMGYLAWLIYGIFLCVRVWLIFWDFAQHLLEKDFFGPNTLKVAVAMCAFVFLLLVASHHDAKPGSEHQIFIKGITTSVTMDLLDTVAILELLFIQQNHVFLTFELHKAILVIASINILLPIVPLLVLSKTTYGQKGMSKKMRVVQHFIALVFINTPLFSIRMIVWHVHNQNVSVFVIKNLLGIAVSIKTLIEEFAAADAVDGRAVGEDIAMHDHPSEKPDIERETDISISEAATLPIRHRAEPSSSESHPRFV